MKNIMDYLPKKEKMTNFQTKVPKNLKDQVKREMKEDNIADWSEFLTACFKNYLDNKALSKKNESGNSVLSNTYPR